MAGVLGVIVGRGSWGVGGGGVGGGRRKRRKSRLVRWIDVEKRIMTHDKIL